jgi:serine phosphatase RsbU (regulator of sigma subunit)
MDVPYLKWRTVSGQEQVFELKLDEVLIGRLSESHIVLTNPYISRRHAKIASEGSERLLVDLQSTHGTFVNGTKINEHKLTHADRISLGRDQVELIYVAEEDSASGLDLGDQELDKSMMQLTSVIPLADAEASNIEKISHILDFQYNWEKSFSAEKTFRQILEAALKLSGAERGFILLKALPDFKYVVGMNGFGQLLSEDEFQASKTVVKEVVREGDPVIMTANIDQQFKDQQSILAMSLRAVACMPLKWLSDEAEELEVRGILYLDSTKTMHALSGLDQKILTKLAAEAANVFEKLEMIEAMEQRKALEKELDLAHETQRSLLPATLPDIEGFEIAAFSFPTRHVGGDFYDFLCPDSSSLTGVLADVSGKGISAALLSSLLQGALQMQCRSGVQLNGMVKQANSYLCERSQSNRFVTLFGFSLSSAGMGEYLSAGHNPAYLYRAASQSVEELPSKNLVLGAFGFATFETTPLNLDSGDLLVVYSDGVTEAMNPQDEMFGEERLLELIRGYAVQGCEFVRSKILEEIKKFTEGMDQTDDMTLLLVRKS